jgi:hypothetical protein
VEELEAVEVNIPYAWLQYATEDIMFLTFNFVLQLCNDLNSVLTLSSSSVVNRTSTCLQLVGQAESIK